MHLRIVFIWLTYDFRLNHLDSLAGHQGYLFDRGLIRLENGVERGLVLLNNCSYASVGSQLRYCRSKNIGGSADINPGIRRRCGRSKTEPKR
jgi:hypothetical protein